MRKSSGAGKLTAKSGKQCPFSTLLYCRRQFTVVAPKCSSVVEEDKSCFMIRFRNRRTTLTKELLKKRRGGDVKELEAFFKRLKDNQLEMLHRAVETEGKDPASCVLLSKDRDPHVLCCQTWRWPDIRNVDIRRLPVCKSASDTIYICCNPYHWSKLYLSGKSSIFDLFF